MATEDVTRFEPDLLKGKGMIDLEKKAYDYGQSLKAVRVDEVIMGNVVGAGQGQNVARQAMHPGRDPQGDQRLHHQQGLRLRHEGVALAAQSIRAGDAEVVLAGGMENMSLIPYSLPAARWGARMNNVDLVDLMVFDGLYEIFYGYHMGVTAENIADPLRDLQEGAGRARGPQPRSAPGRRLRTAFSRTRSSRSSSPRERATRSSSTRTRGPWTRASRKWPRSRPPSRRTGPSPRGTPPGINDAAAAVLVMSEKKAKEFGLKPLVKIRAYATGGVDPAYMGIGPVPAVRKILSKEKLTIGDFGAIELNEAFASQAIACMRELKCDPEKTNILGSGISIGHPIGASGARLLVTLMNTMVRKGHALGLGALCIGGGQGMAMVFERV